MCQERMWEMPFLSSVRIFSDYALDIVSTIDMFITQNIVTATFLSKLS